MASFQQIGSSAWMRPGGALFAVLTVAIGGAVFDARPAGAVQDFAAVQSGVWSDPAT